MGSFCSRHTTPQHREPAVFTAQQADEIQDRWAKLLFRISRLRFKQRALRHHKLKLLVSITNHNQHCVAKAALLDVLRDLFYISSAELLRPWNWFGSESQAGLNDFAKVLKSSCHS